MCGICGFWGLNDKKLLKKMTDIMKHRGPDDEGFYTDKNIGLGHRRLSIIDLGGGHQPMHNEDESIWTVFNGEIYNYLELRKLLEERGHKFYSNSDTEVIIHAYEEFGEDCPKKLRGMFAFAIWNSNKKILFIARDRLGKKPLYYTFQDGVFLFASEIKAILEYPAIKRLVNLQALHNYLSFRYVPFPDTMFEGIFKLPPAHSLTLKNGKISIKEYWDLDLTPVPEQPEQYYIQKLRQLLEECVKIRLMSDVPLGAFLSGGLDSSSVVGIMSKLMDEPVKTFSVGFGMGGNIDETSHAQLVADYFGTDHHEIIVKEDSAKLLPKLVWHMDEPLADSAAIPTFLVSQLARKHVTVVLTGEGADEAFAGYDRYYTLPTANRVRLPGAARSFFTQLQKITPNIWKLKRGVRLLSTLGDIKQSFFNYMSMYTEEEKQSLYLTPHKQDSSIKVFTPYFTKSKHLSILNQLLYVDTKTWLPEDLLMKVDKMSMAASIEARAPFIDHEMVQFAMTVPPGLKMRGSTSKYILRKAVSDLLPKQIQERRKHGFDVPIEQWFTGDLKDTTSDLLSGSKYFNHKKVQEMLYQHQKGIRNNAQRLWTLLIFEFWNKLYWDEKM